MKLVIYLKFVLYCLFDRNRFALCLFKAMQGRIDFEAFENVNKLIKILDFSKNFKKAYIKMGIKP